MWLCQVAQTHISHDSWWMGAEFRVTKLGPGTSILTSWLGYGRSLLFSQLSALSIHCWSNFLLEYRILGNSLSLSFSTLESEELGQETSRHLVLIKWTGDERVASQVQSLWGLLFAMRLDFSPSKRKEEAEAERPGYLGGRSGYLELPLVRALVRAHLITMWRERKSSNSVFGTWKLPSASPEYRNTEAILSGSSQGIELNPRVAV